MRTQYNDLRQQRERLIAAGEEGQCPTCARPLGGHYRTVLDLLTEQADTVQVDGKYFRDRLEQLEQMPADVRALDERRRALTQDVGALERRLAKVQLAVQEGQQVARENVGQGAATRGARSATSRGFRVATTRRGIRSSRARPSG